MQVPYRCLWPIGSYANQDFNSSMWMCSQLAHVTNVEFTVYLIYKPI